MSTQAPPIAGDLSLYLGVALLVLKINIERQSAYEWMVQDHRQRLKRSKIHSALSGIPLMTEGSLPNWSLSSESLKVKCFPTAKHCRGLERSSSHPSLKQGSEGLGLGQSHPDTPWVLPLFPAADEAITATTRGSRRAVRAGVRLQPHPL